MKPAIVAIAVPFMLVSAGCLAAERSVYVPTHGPNCVDHSREHEGAWSCAGPARFAVDFADEGNVASVALRTPKRVGKSAAFVFAGRAKVFGDAVEWILDGDDPKAAVLRIWRAEVSAEGQEREIQELAVFKITSREVCPVGTVDARRPGANEDARRLASEGSVLPCRDPDRRVRVTPLGYAQQLR
jgi:hypothetical protein